MASYKLDLRAKELLGMLSSYYTEKNGHPIEVKVKLNTMVTGYPYEEEVTKISFYYEEDITILGYTAIKTTEISLDELKDIISELIGQTEFDIDDINEKIGYRSSGYDRYESSEPYLEKITINLKEKQKELTRIFLL